MESFMVMIIFTFAVGLFLGGILLFSGLFSSDSYEESSPFDDKPLESTKPEDPAMLGLAKQIEADLYGATGAEQPIFRSPTEDEVEMCKPLTKKVAKKKSKKKKSSKKTKK